MADIAGDLETMIDVAIQRDIEDRSSFFLSGDHYWDVHGEQSVDVFPARNSDGGIEGHGNTIELKSIDENCVEGVSPASIYEKWESRIYGLFRDFDDLPQSGDFDISGLQAATELLAVVPESFPNADDGESLEFEVEGNDEFTKVASASSTFSLMQGQTADAFRKFFLDPFPLVTQRQYAIAQMLLAAVEGERNIWDAMETDVPNLVTESINAFATRSSAGTDWGVVGAIAGVAGLIPGFGQVAGGVGAIAGLFGAFPDPEPKKTEFELSGDDPESTWSDIEKAAQELKDAVKEQESTMAEHLVKITSRVSGNPELFDLNAIDDEDDQGNESESDEFTTETNGSNVISDKGVMNLEFQIMHDTGSDLIDVSSVFRSAAKELNGGLSASGWTRPWDIGDGSLGHYTECDNLREALVTILLNTEQALQRGGEVVQIAAKRIKGKDDEVQQDLDKHKDQVDRFERRENAPPPRPPSSPYPPGLMR